MKGSLGRQWWECGATGRQDAGRPKGPLPSSLPPPPLRVRSRFRGDVAQYLSLKVPLFSLPLFQISGLRCRGDECFDVAGIEVGDASGTQVVELGSWFGVELVGYGTPNGRCQGEAVTGEAKG